MIEGVSIEGDQVFLYFDEVLVACFSDFSWSGLHGLLFILLIRNHKPMIIFICEIEPDACRVGAEHVRGVYAIRSDLVVRVGVRGRTGVPAADQSRSESSRGLQREETVRKIAYWMTGFEGREFDF